MTRGLRLPSGRVIAIGRYMLASLFLLAIWLNASPPLNALAVTWGVLGAYFAFALIALAATWKDWWLDARLAGAFHAIDILVFTFLVFSTEGYMSPFFASFMFVLLSAAIRWGWRSTALSAILLVHFYLLGRPDRGGYFCRISSLRNPNRPPHHPVGCPHVVRDQSVAIRNARPRQGSERRSLASGAFA